MKKIIAFLIGLVSFTSAAKAQTKYLSAIVTKADIRNNAPYIIIGVNYWRYDTCLYSKRMCRYNHSTGFAVKIDQAEETVICELLRGNNSGYRSKTPYDTFTYTFSGQHINASKLVRKLLIKEKYVRTDTFSLTAIDTLTLNNAQLIKRAFGKQNAMKQDELKIYVLKSVDNNGSVMLHFWVERVGIIKLTDEKCWLYSFELKDERTKPIKNLYAALVKIIKQKYKDPYWLSDTCSIAQ